MAEKQQQEPELAVDQIQGNVIPGFNKHFQAFLFLKIVEESDFRRWLNTLIFSTDIARITTTKEVLAFRELLGKEKRKETWVNIAFSHSALVQLGMISKDEKFKDQAFRQGLRVRSASLGDPIDGEGNPRTWVVGGPDNEADVILIVASDDPDDLSAQVTRIRESISSGKKTNENGVRIIFKQGGVNLPESREHFGFRDGVSQPGVRGLIPGNLDPFLTPRNPGDPNQGKRGEDLLWPGEFVFGREYPRQDPNDKEAKGSWNSLDHDPYDVKKQNDVKKQILEPPVPAAPAWAKNGSFLVFRRLRQDVWAFHKFLYDKALEYGFTAEEFGEMCVGRRVSGAPIFSNHGQKSVDDDFDKNNPENNAFGFQKNMLDPEGKICPFAAHIRRTNTRDDLNKNEAQTHRLLRRGIPYGEPSTSTFAKPKDDMVDRGLLFIAYQTSIENQFEYMQKLANNPWFREGNPGYDPIIGQNNKGNLRTFSITPKDRRAVKDGRVKVPLPEVGWVTPTGGGYFFAPSINALEMLVDADRKRLS